MNPEQSKSASEFTMKVACGWCNKDMGTKKCLPHMAGATSHSICQDCATKMKLNINPKGK